MYVVMYVFVNRLCLFKSVHCVCICEQINLCLFKSVHLYLACIVNYLSANYRFCILFISCALISDSQQVVEQMKPLLLYVFL